MIEPSRIRNLSIISHIDHGKTTLSDRILELTGAVDARDMRAQYLDSMDLERERGITIKAQNVRLNWKNFVIHLIDTPGHVDFGYEVSRSLAACEGAILLVDATQGIEAQTLAPRSQAMAHDLEIGAAVNNIDLAFPDPNPVAAEMGTVLGTHAPTAPLPRGPTGRLYRVNVCGGCGHDCFEQLHPHGVVREWFAVAPSRLKPHELKLSPARAVGPHAQPRERPRVHRRNDVREDAERRAGLAP